MEFDDSDLSEEEEDDEDEAEEIKQEFKEMNITKVNVNSVTINIPTSHIQQWEMILTRNYGLPIDRSSSNNGKQFRTLDRVSITIWWKQNEAHSTMLISGSKNYLKFAINEIPRLFREFVRELNENTKKRKVEDKPPASIDCDLCEKVIKRKDALLAHKKQFHTVTYKEPKKTKGSVKGTNIEVDQNKVDPIKLIVYRCNQCSHSFNSSGNLSLHKGQEHYCDKCGSGDVEMDKHSCFPVFNCSYCEEAH